MSLFCPSVAWSMPLIKEFPLEYLIIIVYLYMFIYICPLYAVKSGATQSRQTVYAYIAEMTVKSALTFTVLILHISFSPFCGEVMSNFTCYSRSYCRILSLTHWAGSGLGSSRGTGCGPGQSTGGSACGTGGIRPRDHCSGVRGRRSGWHSAHGCPSLGLLSSWCSLCPVDQSRSDRCCDTLGNRLEETGQYYIASQWN